MCNSSRPEPSTVIEQLPATRTHLGSNLMHRAQPACQQRRRSPCRGNPRYSQPSMALTGRVLIAERPGFGELARFALRSCRAGRDLVAYTWAGLESRDSVRRPLAERWQPGPLRPRPGIRVDLAPISFPGHERGARSDRTSREFTSGNQLIPEMVRRRCRATARPGPACGNGVPVLPAERFRRAPRRTSGDCARTCAPRWPAPTSC